MANELYYRGSSSYETAIQNQLVENNRSIREMEYGIRSDIRESTYAIVASNKILNETYKEGFDELNHTLDFGLLRLETEISFMKSSVCDKLDEIHDIVNNPLLTASRELFRRAKTNFDKGFFEEALEDCLSAVEKNKTDFISWYLLGQIYLFGAGKFSNVINLEKAEEALFTAAKYISPDIENSEEARIMASNIFSHLAYSKLLISNDCFFSGDSTKSNTYLTDAERNYKDAVNYDTENLIAIYNYAKCLHFLKKDSEALEYIKQCIIGDESYALQACSDVDFKSIWDAIENIINNLREDLSIEINDSIDELLKSNYILDKYQDKIWGEYVKIITTFRERIKSQLDYYSLLEMKTDVSRIKEKKQEIYEKAVSSDLIYNELSGWNTLIEKAQYDKDLATYFDERNMYGQSHVCIGYYSYLFYDEPEYLPCEGFDDRKVRANRNLGEKESSFQIIPNREFTKTKEFLYIDASSFEKIKWKSYINVEQSDEFLDLTKFAEYYKICDTDSDLVHSEAEKLLENLKKVLEYQSQYYDQLDREEKQAEQKQKTARLIILLVVMVSVFVILYIIFSVTIFKKASALSSIMKLVLSISGSLIALTIVKKKLKRR